MFVSVFQQKIKTINKICLFNKNKNKINDVKKENRKETKLYLKLCILCKFNLGKW